LLKSEELRVWQLKGRPLLEMVLGLTTFSAATALIVLLIFYISRNRWGVFVFLLGRIAPCTLVS